MEDEKIVALYWERNEEAIHETEMKYGAYLTKIAHNILNDIHISKRGRLCRRTGQTGCFYILEKSQEICPLTYTERRQESNGDRVNMPDHWMNWESA